ncbi:hypothetical protein K7J14_05060 [Treponema zuelzerae]|uniref:Uncharacterized protein n=1 Tax=Teretinema zuelzerae TaxID=156 RepID=A0AAE3EIC1_9SPIR|nr:hypothetical protein [Teretinema zuelzerae]MCD1654068.1 hypothetical protein [Teretinema zuelzerae]
MGRVRVPIIGNAAARDENQGKRRTPSPGSTMNAKDRFVPPFLKKAQKPLWKRLNLCGRVENSAGASNMALSWILKASRTALSRFRFFALLQRKAFVYFAEAMPYSTPYYGTGQGLARISTKYTRTCE